MATTVLKSTSSTSIWRRSNPKSRVAYTQIATISTDDHHTLQEFRALVGAQLPFLSDPERTIQRDLDIQEYTDLEHDPMIPYTLVLKPGLVVHSIYNGYWFWVGPSIDELRLGPACRDPRGICLDWDLSTPLGFAKLESRRRFSFRLSTDGTSGPPSRYRRLIRRDVLRVAETTVVATTTGPGGS